MAGFMKQPRSVELIGLPGILFPALVMDKEAEVFLDPE
jgi:hypothetical protein